ncbi:MAG: hypothetical protein SPF56_08645 [Bacteroidaceae bacterium]|nr:hypothetical protein [Bacteroidaceae bacterium]
MIKTYKANTNVSINVVLANKKNLRISFVPLSNGSSVFTTDNEEVMEAIERHYKFGTLFRLYSTQGEGKKTAVQSEGKKTAVQSDANEQLNEVEAAEKILKKVNVSDLAAAKDYLADTFGISRTYLRSEKSIKEQALANGIEFDGI